MNVRKIKHVECNCGGTIMSMVLKIEDQTKRIADLESKLAEHKRDAELCRELRALLKLPSVTICSDARTLTIYTPISFEIQDKFREIRDGSGM